ncbi:type II toxin-antitoxin system Phd/YefM family antitoxin [Thioalkalivibrio sp. ALE11]|uniref:type II toxin-antitoxin system Phd/YefM family antitoxin n=1 Tax=Thioalkalivibrio sp. ALE11 TaxID=1265494 RepID=UPI00036E9587|nr:type II toxin-antitoxin system prevent-host-death family antitoxin [Thioalkalivibrio sp. ALE11]
MSDSTINLADAKARLSELAERAASGENIIITRRGKAVVRLSRATPARQPIDADALRALTDAQSSCSEQDLVRSLRDDARY